MSAARHYPDDGLAPEHIQQGMQIMYVFGRLIDLEKKVEALAELEQKVEALEQENKTLLKRVKGNEAAAPI